MQVSSKTYTCQSCGKRETEYAEGALRSRCFSRPDLVGGSRKVCGTCNANIPSVMMAARDEANANGFDTIEALATAKPNYVIYCAAGEYRAGELAKQIRSEEAWDTLPYDKRIVTQLDVIRKTESGEYEDAEFLFESRQFKIGKLVKIIYPTTKPDIVSWELAAKMYELTKRVSNENREKAKSQPISTVSGV